MRKDKEKTREYQKQWKLKNPDRVKTYEQKNKEWYLKNKERCLAVSKKWRAENPDKVKSYLKKYKENNPERVKQSITAWNKRNPEKVLANRRRYILEHPNYYKDFNKRHPYRKYKKYGVDIAKIAEQQKGKCIICEKEKKLVVDHDHQKDIIRELLCITCNAGLGCFYDDLVSLQNAIKYLKKHATTS